MLKYREGKLMVFNLIIIFAAILCVSYVIPNYGVNTYYNVATYLIAVVLLLLSVCQIMLARKLFRIAKEESQVASKTKVE